MSENTPRIIIVVIVRNVVVESGCPSYSKRKEVLCGDEKVGRVNVEISIPDNSKGTVVACYGCTVLVGKTVWTHSYRQASGVQASAGNLKGALSEARCCTIH